jgi:hypothetical protein
MAKKTARKLALKRETLRQLNSDQLARVAGGYYSGDCWGAVETKNLGSTIPSPVVIISYSL